MEPGIFSCSVYLHDQRKGKVGKFPSITCIVAKARSSSSTNLPILSPPCIPHISNGNLANNFPSLFPWVTPLLFSINSSRSIANFWAIMEKVWVPAFSSFNPDLWTCVTEIKAREKELFAFPLKASLGSLNLSEILLKQGNSLSTLMWLSGRTFRVSYIFRRENWNMVFPMFRIFNLLV